MKGATVVWRIVELASDISIHAPVKGATFRIVEKYIARDDFNPRSREGSDYQGRGDGPVGKDFNPRSREGSDQIVRTVGDGEHISIHAPVKGATGFGSDDGQPEFYFNPRSREGSDDSMET